MKKIINKRKKYIIGIGIFTVFIAVFMIKFTLSFNQDGTKVIKIASAEKEIEIPLEGTEIIGQNFIHIDDDLVGSLIRDINDGRYYLGIEKSDGSVKQSDVRQECSNLLLYGEYLYFINDSFPYTMQNIWKKDSGKGRIMRIGRNVEDASLSEKDILTREDELTNCFYLWKNRIYYQVVETAGEDVYFRIYSITLEGQARDEVYSGLNWTADFAMEEGYIYIAGEEGGITRVDVEHKKSEKIIPENMKEYEELCNSKLKEIVVEKNMLYVLRDDNGERYTSVIQLDMLLAGSPQAIINQGKFDVATGITLMEDDKKIQRDENDLYIYNRNFIYRLDYEKVKKQPYIDWNSAEVLEQKVGTEVKEEKTWKIDDQNTKSIGRNFYVGDDFAISEDSLYTTDFGKFQLYGKGLQYQELENPIVDGVSILDSISILRQKGGKIEEVVSHIVREGDLFVDEYGNPLLNNMGETRKVNKLSIDEIAYAEGNVYYILRYEHQSEDENYCFFQNYICRVNGDGGEGEILGLCDGKFLIYDNKIYFTYNPTDYGWLSNGTFLWEMSLDGSGKKLISDDNIIHFTIGGGSLYIETLEGLRGIHLKTGQRKCYENVENIWGMYYEDGYIYYRSNSGMNPLCRLNVITGKVEEILEQTSNQCFIKNNYFFDIYYDETQASKSCGLQITDLTTKESRLYSLASYEFEKYTTMSFAGDEIIIMIATWEGDFEDAEIEYSYVKQDIEDLWATGFSGAVY